MRVPDVLYKLYERRVHKEIEPAHLPRHVGVILDGNRRWAKAYGSPVSDGHRKGADKISELLDWSVEVGVEVVTLWMLSTDNLSRGADELSELLAIISSTVERLSAAGRWRIRLVGDLSLLPSEHVERLRAAERTSAAFASAMVVNIAVGYGGRQEIADAVRSLLRERAEAGQDLATAAESISVEDIADHLYTAGQPDPDLVIRTSGEQRLSGFLLWQSVHSEYYFCEVYWPDFRHTDFLRALRDYSRRDRRLGK